MFQNKKHISIAIALIGLIVSCKKGELPVPKHEPGDVTTATVDMNANYKYQIYFNLEKNEIVASNEKKAWDLGFETSPEGRYVILNTSKAMFAANMGETSFEDLNELSDFEQRKKWDNPTGNLDSTAIGNWQANHVYIIDRGYDEDGKHQGYRKLQILYADDTKFTVRFAQLDNADDTTIDVMKDDTYNFTFLSFSTNNTLIVEPPKTDWDLAFTQYTETFYNNSEKLAYLVTGCLQNRFKVLAAADTTNNFSDITYAMAEETELKTELNTIGFDWKTYDYNQGSFITHPEKNYVIQDHKGLFYKLHFIDFYDKNGNKGNPVFEYQQL